MLLPASCPRLRNVVVLVGALLTCSHAFAQRPLDQKATEVDPNGVRLCETPQDAGTYHVATGILTPPGAEDHSSFVVPGVIYNNTCSTPYFQSCLNGTTWLDDGRVPSATSPAPNTGTLNNYRVNQFQIAYCTRDVTGV